MSDGWFMGNEDGNLKRRRPPWKISGYGMPGCTVLPEKKTNIPHESICESGRGFPSACKATLLTVTES